MKIRLLVLVALAVVLTGCGVTRSTSFYDHKPQLIRSEMDGSCVIRVSAKDRNAAKSMLEARKMAVYEVVFNGVPSATAAVNSLKPLILEVNAKDKYQGWFNNFISSGEYKKYISVEDKRVASTDFFRNQQRVQCVTNVTVYVPALKDKLREDNIIK